MSLTIVAILLFLAAAAFVTLAIRREMRAAPPAKVRVRLYKMMRRRGLPTLPTPPSEAQTRAFSAAIRRCRQCNHKALCDEWLAKGEGEPTFCPNTGWFAKLRQDFLTFR